MRDEVGGGRERRAYAAKIRSRPQLIAEYQRRAPQRDACEAYVADLMRAYPEGPP